MTKCRLRCHCFREGERQGQHVGGQINLFPQPTRLLTPLCGCVVKRLPRKHTMRIRLMRALQLLRGIFIRFLFYSLHASWGEFVHNEGSFTSPKLCALIRHSLSKILSPAVWGKFPFRGLFTSNLNTSTSVWDNQSNRTTPLSLQSDKVQRGVEVQVEWWATHVTFTQETRVWVSCETKCCWLFPQHNHVVFVPKLKSNLVCAFGWDMTKWR